MARSGIRLLMSIGVLCLLNFHLNANGEGDVRVELECRIVPEAAPTPGAPLDPYLVQIQTPTGSLISQATTAAAGRLVFKRLLPGIVVACVIGAHGRRRCQSVDVNPGPHQKLARFSVDLRVPSVSWSPTESLFVVPKDILRIPKKARREFDRARKAQAQGDTAEATRRLQSALEIWPDYAEALVNLGALSHSDRDYDRAIGCFRRAVAIAPTMLEGWLNLGVTQLVTGEFREALKSELRALALRPDDPFVHYQVGLCQYKLNQFDEAKEHLRRVVELDPCSATYPHLYLARIALAENEPGEAARLLADFSRLHPHGDQPLAIREIQQKIERARPGGQPVD